MTTNDRRHDIDYGESDDRYADPDAQTHLMRPVEQQAPRNTPASAPETRQQPPVYRQEQGYRDSHYARPEQPQGQPNQQNRERYNDVAQSRQNQQQEDSGPTLIAGKFVSGKLIANLTILAVLAGVVTFAVALIVDLIVARVDDAPSLGNGHSIILGVIVAALAVVSGVLYIPVDGTGNEGLFSAAILALTCAAAVFYVIFGGLLDQDWSTLVTLAAIVCAGVAAYAAPTRILTATP